MDTLLEQINSAGKIFVQFGWSMLLQSSALIVALLLADFVLRKKVRAVVRYWVWMLVLVKLVLPTTLASPVSMGALFGERLPALSMATNLEDTPAASLPDMNLLPRSMEMKSRHKLEVPLDASGNKATSAEWPRTFVEANSISLSSVAMEDTVLTAAQIQPPLHANTFTWQGMVFIGWAAIVAAMLLLLIQRAMFVCGLVRQANQANGIMSDTLRFCCKQMGLREKIGLKISPNAVSPAVCGLMRPVILIPQNLGSSLGANHLRTVLLHELAHIKRGDLWINLVQTLLQIVYFYNPFLWLANWAIRRVREQAVDEMVQVALGEKAREYPETLLNVAKFAFERPALSLRLVGVVESKNALTGRIKKMLNQPIPKTAKLGIAGLLAVLLIGAVLLPMAKAEDGGPKTDDAMDLQGRIDSAKAGETVVVPSGSYTSPIKVNKAIMLKGESRDKCIFEVTANEPAIVIDTANKGRVVLENVTIKWQLATSDKCEMPYAVVVKDTPARIRNCTFEPLGDFKRSPVAFQALGFADVNVADCAFNGYEYTVCFGEGTKGVVQDCVISDSGHQGIIAYEGADVKITRSVICGSGYHGVRSTGGKIDVRDNLIIDNKNRGIYLGNKSASGQIINNVIIRNSEGISGFAQSELVIRNNVIAESTFAAVDMRSSCRMTIRDNIICGNAQGVIEFKEGAAGANKLLANTFWQNKADVNNIDKPASCINADPVFNNAANGDFSLQDGPVKAAGHGPANPDVFRKLWDLRQAVGGEKVQPIVSMAEMGTDAAKVDEAAAAKGRTRELLHDDGKKADMLSISGGGHCVKFKRPTDGNFLTAVKIYGSRYGEYEPPAEDFYVWLCDPNLEMLKEFAFSYSHFKMRGLARWVELKVDPTELPQEFIICVGFDPHQTKGVYVYYDAAASGNSFTGLPGGKIEPFNKGDWMIRAVVAKEAKPVTTRRAAPRMGPPAIVSTTPKAMANDVSASLTEITATFDQPMMDKSWSWTGGGDTYPKTTGDIAYDEDKRTCKMPVELEAGKVYWVGINSPSYQNFKSAGGTPARRYVILFATAGADGKPTAIPGDMLERAQVINGQSGATR